MLRWAKNSLKKYFYLILNRKEYLRTKRFVSEVAKQQHEVIFLITCGPSLSLFLENPSFRELLARNTCIAMKQAFNFFPSEVDFHVVNEIRYQNYNYQDSSAVVLSTGTKTPEIKSDFHFPILEHSYSKSVFVTNKYNENTLLKRPVFRPWGIGVMYELGLFLPHLLNCKKLVIVGFDMNPSGKYHFYDITDETDATSYAVDKDEFIYNKTTIPHLENWLSINGIEVALMSPMSALPFSQKLNSFEELEDFLNRGNA